MWDHATHANSVLDDSSAWSPVARVRPERGLYSEEGLPAKGHQSDERHSGTGHTLQPLAQQRRE